MTSFLNMYESIDAKTMAESLRLWALSPIEGRTAPDGANMLGLRHDKTLGLLSTSSSTVRQNRVLVHRSRALLDGGNFYGPNFFYNEYQKVPSSFAGVRAKVSTKLLEASLSSALSRLAGLTQFFGGMQAHYLQKLDQETCACPRGGTRS